MEWLEAFSWPRIGIDLLNIAPTHAIYLFALSRVMRPYSSGSFWVICMVASLLWSPFRTLVPTPVMIFMGLLLMIGLPGAMLQGRALGKSIALILGAMLMIAADIPSALTWVLLTGDPVMDYDAVLGDPTAYLVATLVHLIVFTLLMCLYVVICKRSSLLGAVYPDPSRSSRTGGMYGVFLWFPAVQMCLLYAVFAITFVVIGNDAVFYGSVLALFAFSLVADGFVLRGMKELSDKQLSDLRAASLEARADEYLAKAAHMQGQLRDAARLRHDLRNHVHVVEGLCERGDMAEAQAYLHRVSGLLDAGERS